MPEMVTEDLVTTDHEVSVERFLETLYGIRTGESRPRTRAFPTLYHSGDDVGSWLRLWGLGERP
jgi:hypothetical protein